MARLRINSLGSKKLPFDYVWQYMLPEEIQNYIYIYYFKIMINKKTTTITTTLVQIITNKPDHNKFLYLVQV